MTRRKENLRASK